MMMMMLRFSGGNDHNDDMYMYKDWFNNVNDVCY